MQFTHTVLGTGLSYRDHTYPETVKVLGRSGATATSTVRWKGGQGTQ